VDANQAYTVKQAITAIGRMAEHGLDICEQPVRADDLKGLEAVTRAVPVAVEADEAASSVEAVMTLAANHIVDSVNLKIPPLGGLRNTLAAARICEAANIPCRMGASFCSQILQAQALHLATALPALGYACELSEFIHFQNDPFSGLAVKDGMLGAGDAPGSGVAFSL
jgi:L-alanine-DL-glutamate epimerase-like enolase superfamily enzyme